jgi:hypothetical protein
MRTTSRALLVLPLLLLAPAALATEAGGSEGANQGLGVDLTLHAGFDKYDAVGLESGLGGLSESSLLKDASNHLGATVILRSGILEIGAIGEVGRPGQDGSTTLLGALGGVGLDVGILRLEALGELGAHRYGDVLADPSVVTRSTSEVWLVSAGLRPGISLRLGESRSFILGLWGFARWDLTSENVQVTLADGASSTYKVGGAQFGVSLRVGVSL